MTVDEIFEKLTTHMIKGLMVHEQMSSYYHFLNLEGYKCCHEYHYFEESMCHLKVLRFYVNKYNKLIPENKFDVPNVIPAAWYKATRQDVGTSTKRTAVKDGLVTWLKWEKETWEHYKELYHELVILDEMSAAHLVKKLMSKVEEEIMYIEKKQLDLSTLDYSIEYIFSEQDKVTCKYKDKKKELFSSKER